MTYIKILLTLTAGALLNACASSYMPLYQQLTEQEHAYLDKVYQYSVNQAKVTFIVKSHGCTLPEHFTLKQQINPNGQLELALLRAKQDWCRAMPRAFPVRFKLEHGTIATKDIVLVNQLEQSETLPRHSKVNNKY